MQEMKVVWSWCSICTNTHWFALSTFHDQEMMMQIMDKYVHAGEALAWKENEVLDLTKQVWKTFNSVCMGTKVRRDIIFSSH